MKIKVLLFFLTFLLSTSNSLAQQVFPQFSDGAHWNVLECFWLECYTYEYEFEYDTMFCGQQYSKVNFSSIQNNGYFRSDTSRTYFRKSTNCMEKEYLLYDYSIDIGDTVFVGYDLYWNSGKDTAEFVLDDIDTITQFGIDRIRYKMLYDPGNQGQLYRPMYWIQGIGGDRHPFYPFQCLWDGCEEGFQTLCYDSMGVQLYQNPWANDCDTTILGLSELENKISVYPNPFDDEIFINLENTTIRQVLIYSLLGEKSKEVTIEDSKFVKLETSDLIPGAYFLEILTNNGVYTKRIIKME